MPNRERTVANIWKKHGIEPAPERERKTTWKEFPRRHWNLIVAANFFTVEVWTHRDYSATSCCSSSSYPLVGWRSGGIDRDPNGLWMSQIGSNLTECSRRILNGKRYLIHGVRLPPRSPNLNAYAERFVRSIKESCLDKMILFGEGELRRAVHEFVTHYLTERNHQGLGSRLIMPDLQHLDNRGAVQCHERLGGLLNYYHRAAA